MSEARGTGVLSRTRLSVNLNKIALLRNARDLDLPNLCEFAAIVIGAGAHGITVHPRPDERHIRHLDVPELAQLLKDHPDVEYNIEGNPFESMLDLVKQVRPHQATLVPDSPGQRTSDHGWNVAENAERLRTVIEQIHDVGTRVSLFMDADSTEWELVREIGADRVELYTEPYAVGCAGGDPESAVAPYVNAAELSAGFGLGINAGHDLSLKNLKLFVDRVPDVLEVSIGHALTSEALIYGMQSTVERYLRILDKT